MSWSVITEVKHGYTQDSYHIVESNPLELYPVKVKDSSFADFKSNSRINGLLQANYRSHMLFTGEQCTPIVDINPFPARNTKISIMSPDGSCFGSISFGTLMHYLYTGDVSLNGNGWIYIGLDDNHFIMKSSSFDVENSSPIIFLFRYIDIHLCLLSVEIWLPYEPPKVPKWTIDENHLNDTGLRSDWRQGEQLMVVKNNDKKSACLLRDDCKPIFVWDKSLCSMIIIVRGTPEFEYKYVLDKTIQGCAIRHLCDCGVGLCDKFCQFELCNYDFNRRNVTKFLFRTNKNGDSELLSIEVYE